MKRDERWFDRRDVNPWLDHASDQPDHSPQETLFQTAMRENRECFLRLVRLCQRKMSSTLDRYMLLDALLFSVSTMLTVFVIFWTFFIFAILAGLLLTWTFLNILAASCGRKMQRFARHIRNALSGARVVPETASAKLQTTSTSAATPDSNS